MTQKELFDLLSFETELKQVQIVSQTELKNDATFIIADLGYDGETMRVPFIHYAGNNWLFTPWDWQGWLPSDPSEIEKIDWMVNDTGIEALMFDGLPCLAPWTPDPKNIAR